MVIMHQDESEHGEPPSVKYFGPMRMEITLGSVINMVILLGGIVGWIATTETSRATLAQKFDDFQASVNIQLTEMRTAFNTVIGQTVTIGEMQSHLHAIDGRLDSIDIRVRDTEKINAQTRADLDNIIRSSSVPVPTERHR